MFNTDTLAQLSALKQEIRTSKNLNLGLVRGTSGRFGFVALEDGRDVYLNAENMDRVFPGDKVEVAVKENEREQLEGQLEKLIQSPLKQITGQYTIKGKGHFVVYNSGLFTRWIFVPPKDRAKSKEGDYVIARITQHPYQNGKAQAKITQNLGSEVNINLIRAACIAQHQLFENWPKDIIDEVKSLPKEATDIAAESRQDLTHLPFITIDAASTCDMDDALAIETNDEYWTLYVAIANPGAEITPKHSIDRIAQKRAHTIYFPGKPLPMLHEDLANKRYSLVQGEERAVLVCKIEVEKASGNTNHFEFIPAKIESKAKMSYLQASRLLAGETLEETDFLLSEAELTQQLIELKAFSEAHLAHRKTHHLVLESRPDYALRLNKQGKLESIEKLERTTAHQIVEESMLATNICAGHFLAKNNTGLFSTHEGFKEERREDIEKLFSESLGEIDQNATADLSQYVGYIRSLQEKPELGRLLTKQQRFQQGSQLSTEAKPHFGLGVEHYATVTSPIRRYQDLHNQRLIHRLLNQQKAETLNEATTEKLREVVSKNRDAIRLVQQWLISDYLSDRIGEEFTAHIALLTNQGVGIRLADSNIEGFIAGIRENKKNPEQAYDKISFNNQRMELTWNETELELDQEVKVKLTGIDSTTKKLAFAWVEKI